MTFGSHHRREQHLPLRVQGKHHSAAAAHCPSKLPSRSTLLRLCLLAFLVVDFFVLYPNGFEWPRRLLAGGKDGLHGEEACGWDEEGSWQIGLVQGGSSPYSFPGSSTQHGINTSAPTFTCQNMKGMMAASFVADPFLIRHDKSTASEPSSNEEWFLFFEYKNLDRYIGEIGVASSQNKGQTWKYLGTALKESFHLSYPFVRKDVRDSQTIFQMIPETGDAQQVRIYETTEEEFPFGWKLAHVPLSGHKFVDTAAVFYQDRFWIFTSIYEGGFQRKSTLKLYHTKSLVDKAEPWIEHPLSPILPHNSHAGRSAGPPVVFEGSIHRFAQEGTHFYGEQVYVYRVNVLTDQDYQEQRVRTLSPHPSHAWTKSRFHHVHAQQSPEDGSWIAVFDGDKNLENHGYTSRFWWFHFPKRLLLVLLLANLFVGIMRGGKDIQSILCHFDCLHRYTQMAQSLCRRTTEHCKKVVSQAKQRAEVACQTRSGQAKYIVILFILLALAWLLAVATTDMKSQCVESNSYPTDECFQMNELVTNSPSFITPLHDNPLSWKNVDSHVWPTEKEWAKPFLNPSNESPESPVDAAPLVVVTGASSGFMERLRNLVGSLHYWEPTTNITIYDLGLKQEHLEEISHWKRVTVLPFPFQEYPTHVSLLYNFAWKIVMLHEFLKRHQRFIYLDSGLEVRHPLINVRHFLEKEGYFSAPLDAGLWVVGRETYPATYDAIKALGVEFEVDDIKPRPFCAGGVQGMVRSPVTQAFMDLSLKCALDEECISPTGSRSGNHQYDQSVLSVIAYAMGIGQTGCDHAPIMADSNPWVYTLDETRCNIVEMGARRWMLPRPYTAHLDRSMPGLDDNGDESSSDSTPLHASSTNTVEMYVAGGLKSAASIKSLKCASECKKSAGDDRQKWEVCVKACQPNNKSRMSELLTARDQAGRTIVVALFKGASCLAVHERTLIFWAIFVLMWMLVLVATSSQRKDFGWRPAKDSEIEFGSTDGSSGSASDCGYVSDR